MASKNGTYLPKEDRTKLLVELQKMGELTSTELPVKILKELADVTRTSAPDDSRTTKKKKHDPSNHDDNSFEMKHKDLMQEPFGTGCLSCGEDDDHANLLLCEGCNAEFHTYCLEPPLRQVPSGDWFCNTCKTQWRPVSDDDGLEKLVSALSPTFTSRFGEVCWAQGGVGFGWWPVFIYDPRWTVGTARDLARKNLGKRHLVYFFECHDAPFAVLTNAKLTKWEDGLMEDYHMGKTARSAGKVRLQSFQQALQAATLELAKPIEMRMDWNHTELPQILPSPQKKKRTKRLRKERSEYENEKDSAIFDNMFHK